MRMEHCQCANSCSAYARCETPPREGAHKPLTRHFRMRFRARFGELAFHMFDLNSEGRISKPEFIRFLVL